MFKLALLSLGALAIVGSASASPVAVSVYDIGATNETGSGIAFSGAPTMSRLLPSGPNGFYIDWDGPISPGNVPGGVAILGGFPPHNGQTLFGADYRGTLHVAQGGSYPITFGADDAGYLFIDGALVASTPGAHGIRYVMPTVPLSAGPHKFEIQYVNSFCCKAVTAFYTPAGVTFEAPIVLRHGRHHRM